MKKVLAVVSLIAFGLIALAPLDVEAKKKPCANAKKQFISYNNALRKEAKNLQRLHKRILVVAPNRVVGYAQSIQNQVASIKTSAKKLKEQSIRVQRACVDKKTKRR